MRLGLREELVEAGLARPSDPVRDIQIDDSRSGVRGSCWVPSGFVWLERGPEELGPPSSRVLHAIRQALDRDDLLRGAAALPVVTPSGTAVYGELPTDSIMVDALMPEPDGRHRDWPSFAEDCRFLGTFLARLHSAESSGANAVALLREDVAMRRVVELLHRGRGDPPATLGLERLQEHLLTGFPELAGALRSLCMSSGRAARSVVLHGRFSSGFVIRDSAAPTGSPKVIGWLEASYGPAAWDVGWFVAELLEVAAGWRELSTAREATVRHGAVVFLGAYASARSGPLGEDFYHALAGYSAFKIVHHLWMFAAFMPYEVATAEALLEAASAALDHDWLALLATEGAT